MPAHFPEPPPKRKGTPLMRLWSWLSAVRSIGLSLTATALLIGGMQAASHFFPEHKPADEGSGQPGANSSSSDELARQFGTWWLPSLGSVDALDSIADASGASVIDMGGAAGGGVAPRPINLNFQNPNDPLVLGGGVRIGGNPWLEPTQIAGLGGLGGVSAASTPSPPATQNTASDAALATTSFSMSQDATQTPANNLSTAGTALATATTVPEPTTGVMLVLAMAGWALRRRREI